MAIRDIPLDIIDDNPYNPRKHYAPAKIKEMADSLREVGMRQGVEGRQVDGRVQLAYGHMRLRAYRHNLKQQLPGSWALMPVDVKELSDRDMFDFALEENLRRTEIKPIEVARCIQGFSGVFPEVTEKTIGEKHGMTEANVSNMLRVLRLPEKFLEKIDEGIITFTQGRELLTLEGLPEAEEIMSSAVNGLKTGSKQFGEPNTVEGLQKSIHNVIASKFPPLDEGKETWRYKLLFDTRAAGCLKCDKCTITHPTKSQAAHYCTDEECWKKKTEEHKEKAAAAAKAKMEAEVLERAQKEVAQRVAAAKEEIKPARGKPVILIGKDLLPHIEASYSGDSISEKGSFVKNPFKYNGKLYINTGDEVSLARRGFDCYELVVPREEYTGVTRTYGVPPGRESQEYYESLRTDPNGFYHGMLVKWGKRVCVLVGPEVTFVYKSDQADISQEMPPAAPTPPTYTTEKRGHSWITLDEQGWVIAIGTTELHAGVLADEYFKPVHTRVSSHISDSEKMLNHTYRIIHKNKTESVPDVTAQDLATAIKAVGVRPENVESFKVWKSSGKLGTNGGVSAGWGKSDTESIADIVVEELEKAHPEKPELEEEVAALEKAKAAAGTRAEVLDLNDICDGSQYSRYMKQGYALLSDELRHIDEPDECLERCTHGFHYAFDSKYPGEKDIFVCSDPKCLTKKKGDLTRKKNAAGQALKNAEREAIKQVLDQVGQVTALVGEQMSGILAVAQIKAPVIAVPRPFLELVIYNQLHGKNVATYYDGDRGKEPSKWFWDKLNAGTTQEKRSEGDLWKLIRKLSDVDLVKLITEYMFFYLQDHGDTGSYEIKTVKPLGFFGVTVEDKVKEKDEVTSGQG